MDGAHDTAIGDLNNKPKDMAEEAMKDILKGNSWWEVLKDTGKKLINPK